MRTTQAVFIIILFYANISLPSALAADPKPSPKVPVSVLSFKNKAAASSTYNENCHGWNWFDTDLGGAFADLLIENLEKNPKYEILERANIDLVRDYEVDLKNSDDTSIKKNKFRKAKVTFIGVVDSFEYCQSGTSVGVDVGSFFGIGRVAPSMKTSSATVSVLIRAVDTTTGKVLATGRAKKVQSKQSIGLDADVQGIDFHGGNFRQTALGEAIHEAIDTAAAEVTKKI